MDFRKQNCKISLSQKPMIWFPKLLFKFTFRADCKPSNDQKKLWLVRRETGTVGKVSYGLTA